MSYKMIAVDLDDTLLNDEREISIGNLRAIKKAHEKGTQIVFCTGRSTKSVLKYVESVEDFKQNDYFISYNGAAITSLEGEILFEEMIPQSHLDHLIDLGRNNKVNINLYQYDDLIVENYTDEVKMYEKLSGTKCKLVSDLKKIDHTYKVLYHDHDLKKLKAIEDQLRLENHDSIIYFYSKPNYLEVLSANSNKGIAVKHLAEHLGIDQDEIIAIGDSYNDLYMIEYAGLGICVKNGKEDIKKIADYVTARTNNESVLEEVVNRFL